VKSFTTLNINTKIFSFKRIFFFLCIFLFLNYLNLYAGSFTASISGPNVFCRGDSVILIAQPNDSNCTFIWSTGAKTSIISVSKPGTYSVIVSRGNESDTAILNLSESEKPKIAILSEGSTKFCDGDSLKIRTVGVSSFYKWQEYYFENFETNKSYQEWSTKATNREWQNPIKRDSNLKPQKRFLGIFGNQSILLTLKNLPDHDSAEITFDLYVIGTWDGNAQGKSGPDIFKVEEITQNKLSYQTTFSLVDGSYQSFPQEYPSGFYPPKYGNKEEFLLSTLITYGNSIKYPLKFQMVHSLDIIKVQLSALLKDKIPNFSNESWAIDNFRMRLRTMLDDSINLKYKWSTGDTAKSIVVGKSGTYQVYGYNSDGCADTASIDIEVFPKPQPVITGGRILCRNEKKFLKTVSQYSGYLWSTGEKSDSIEVILPGSFSVIVTDSNGCSGQSDFEVVANLTPPLKIVTDTVFCPEAEHRLAANGDFVSYRWSTGETSKEIFVSQSGTYTLETVDTNGCVAQDEVYIKDFDFKLSKPVDYDFGVYPVGYKPTTVFQIKNTGANQVFVDSIYLKNSADKIFGFTTTTLTPFLFDTNMMVEVEVSFAPNKKGIFYDTLVLASSKPCIWSISIPLKGLGSVGDTFELFVYLPDTSSVIGAKDFAIPLRSHINTNAAFKNLPWSAVIEFDANYYYPESILIADSISNFVTNGERSVSIKGIIPSLGRDTLVLAGLSGQVLLGEHPKIPLKITNFLIGDTNLKVRKIDGSLSVSGVCRQNLSMVKTYEKNKLEVKQNFSEGTAEAIIRSWEKGEFRLNIYNSIGALCFTSKIPYHNENIELAIPLNLEHLTSGIYFITLETPQNVERCLLVVSH